MTKPPWKNVRLFTALMIGVALIFSACSCLENYLLHPASEENTVKICITLEKYVRLDDAALKALREALRHYPKESFKIFALTDPHGQEEDLEKGKLNDPCCQPSKNHKPDKHIPSSTTVTQGVKHYSSTARDPQAEVTFKEIVRLLGKSK